MTDVSFLWQEFQQVGTDYESVAEVASYDTRMRQMRDIDGENRNILSALQLAKGSRVLEIGTGTGAFARVAAKAGAKVTALDVSQVMLDYAAGKAREEGLENIEFVRAGFLTYAYPRAEFDAVVTSLALHHLPDAWKLAALLKIAASLKPRGRFFLFDVVFHFAEGEAPEAYFARIVESQKESRPNLARHIGQEFSTADWIMEGLLTRAGFGIESSTAVNEFLRAYSCVVK